MKLDPARWRLEQTWRPEYTDITSGGGLGLCKFVMEHYTIDLSIGTGSERDTGEQIRIAWIHIDIAQGRLVDITVDLKRSKTLQNIYEYSRKSRDWKDSAICIALEASLFTELWPILSTRDMFKRAMDAIEKLSFRRGKELVQQEVKKALGIETPYAHRYGDDS